MHIIHRISKSMGCAFDSTKCSYIDKIEFDSNDHKNNGINVVITFVYDNDRLFLTLRFVGVTHFCIERENPQNDIGELLFNDAKAGTPICVADEIGLFRIDCRNVEFVKIKEIDKSWIGYIKDAFRV